MINNRYIYAFLPLSIITFFIFAVSLPPAQVAHSRTDSADGFGTVIIAPGNPIEIALANSLVILEAADVPLAVQLAFSDYGLIKGFSVTSNEFDTGCDPVTAAAVATTIVANVQHVGVIGPLCSSSSQGALPIFEAAGLVMISGTNSGNDLEDFGPTVFNRTIIEDPVFDSWHILNNSLGSSIAWDMGFETTYGHYPWDLARYAYDATILMLTRIDEVSMVDGGGNLVIDRQALASTVRHTIGFEGVSGSISLHAWGTRVNEYQTAVWEDGFNDSVLKPVWSLIDEDPVYWSLTANPGYMRITTQSPTRNRLVQPLPEGDFEIRTSMIFTPTDNFQFAGLSVYLSDDTLLNFGRAYCDLGPPTCLDNAIYYDHQDGGVFIAPNFAMTTTLTAETHLRLVRSGNVYTGYVSTNGTSWIEVGAHTAAFTPTQIGLYSAGQSSPVETPADFDFFIVESVVKNLYLPIINR